MSVVSLSLKRLALFPACVLFFCLLEGKPRLVCQRDVRGERKMRHVEN